MLSADKQFGPRSGLTKCRACSGPKLFDILIVFLKECFEKVDFEKINRQQKRMTNYPVGKELKKNFYLNRVSNVSFMYSFK